MARPSLKAGLREESVSNRLMVSVRARQLVGSTSFQERKSSVGGAWAKLIAMAVIGARIELKALAVGYRGGWWFSRLVSTCRNILVTVVRRSPMTWDLGR